MTAEQWVPIIVAILSAATAILQIYGKTKLAKVAGVLIEQIESLDDDDMKFAITKRADLVGVEGTLNKLVKEVTE